MEATTLDTLVSRASMTPNKVKKSVCLSLSVCLSVSLSPSSRSPLKYNLQDECAPPFFLADHPKSDRIIKQLIVVVKKEEEEEEEPLLAITINCHSLTAGLAETSGINHFGCPIKDIIRDRRRFLLPIKLSASAFCGY